MMDPRVRSMLDQLSATLRDTYPEPLHCHAPGPAGRPCLYHRGLADGIRVVAEAFGALHPDTDSTFPDTDSTFPDTDSTFPARVAMAYAQNVMTTWMELTEEIQSPTGYWLLEERR